MSREEDLRILISKTDNEGVSKDVCRAKGCNSKTRVRGGTEYSRCEEHEYTYNTW